MADASYTQGSTTGAAALTPGRTTGMATALKQSAPVTLKGSGLISGADQLSSLSTVPLSQSGASGLITSNMTTPAKTASANLPPGTVVPNNDGIPGFRTFAPGAAGSPSITPGVVSYKNPVTGQRVTYPAGTPSPGAGWVIG